MSTALAIALVGLTVAACTGQPSEPIPTAARPVATSSTRATPPPSQVPSDNPTSAPAPSTGPDQDMSNAPARPAALDGPGTAENAKAVGRYFMSLVAYVFATGDLQAWDALSGEECSFCSSIRETAAQIHDAGNHGTGGALQLNFTSAFALDDGRFVVSIEYVETPSRTVAADGSLVEDFPDTYSMKADMELKWSGSSWAVSGVDANEWSKNT